MKYFWGILCLIMWALFLLDVIPLDNLNAILSLIFILLANLFFNSKREGEK